MITYRIPEVSLLMLGRIGRVTIIKLHWQDSHAPTILQEPWSPTFYDVSGMCQQNASAGAKSFVLNKITYPTKGETEFSSMCIKSLSQCKVVGLE